MDPALPELRAALDAILARYEKWEAPLHRFQAENFGRLNRDGYTWDQFERGLRELEASLRARYDPNPELSRLLDRLCAAYLGCDSGGRAEIRTCAAERKNLAGALRSYASDLAARIRRPEDAPILRRALAAISIENCGSDYRDTSMILADLYVRAEEVGIDPKPLFEAAGDLSTDAPTPGGCESLAGVLRRFESHAVVRERRAMGRPYGERT